MAQGDFAVMAAPSWMLNQIRDNAPDTEGLCGTSRRSPVGRVTGGGSYLAIPARAETPRRLGTTSARCSHRRGSSRNS
jgi:cellobiose transport system substrate-binding protein